ncbi:DUF5057 domain-containing protein [Paenibacillus planticolens]|uniref:DUF5057 domain-containing protein n=1 Tax=Paenibacillus planticolens TaxID=2654976 RepID=A0ABX1ZK75_9BACL|nr:DUF5057 domain-containing protein [Paenibacillus planticolens]NOU99039.1 DUF5057 domain-containing protein [Paenibacillus planticolens]
MFSAIQKKISIILITSMAISWFGFADLVSQTALAATGDSVTVALKSVDNNKYMTTDTSDNSLYANKTNPWVSDLFDLVEQGESVYALKSRANGKYVTVGSGRKDTLKASSQTINDDQKFKMITNSDATVSFIPVGNLKNYYMSVSSSNNNPITTEQSSSTSSLIKFQLSYFDLTKPLKILEIKDLDKPSSGDASAVISDLASKLGTNSGFTLETMSIKKFVALRDELDGKYDAIYFGKSLFNPTSETGANHNTRYLENDITTLKGTEITEKYINKGLPVIVYSDSNTKRGALYQGYLNGSNWTKSSGNLYNLFNPYNTTPKSNVIFVSETDISNATTFINKTNLLVNANVRPQLNLTSKPVDYTLTTNRDSKYKAGDTLTYTFNVSNVRNIGQRNLVANLYLGIDSVLKFDASNLVQTIPVTSLTNNTLSFTLPKGYSGLYYWRLELVDQTSTGKLKDSAAGVFRYQDQPPTIKVLQVIPDSQSVNKTSSLLLESNLKQNYLHSDDYDINISVIDFNTFNSTEYKTLNSKYDMLIFGFNDSYNQTANISSTAAAAVKSFIATGQGVMFTHDTVYQGNTTWINYFQTDTGQIGPMTNMGLNAPNTSTSTVKINEGLLTEFPFFISELTTSVATTHDQYFRLDLNDPKVIPWYNINGSVRDVEDSWNHYYTYSKGNVTYSGTGHNFVNTTKNSSFPDWEQKLFVNTMYRAFIGSNHKPTLDILSPIAFNETAKNYISANSAISVSFKPDDLDLNDKKLTSSITFKYKDSAGINQTVKVMGDTETNKGETITKTFANPLAESGGDLTISVSTKDAAGALETKEVAVKVITSTGLTPDRTISAEKVEVNSPVTVSYAINPTAKAYSAATNLSDLTISGLHFKETFPANMDLVTFPPNFTKTGSLASGFTLEGDIANIPYRPEGNQFVANSSTFTIVVKPAKAGDYSLSNANLKYNDFASSNQSVLFSNKVVTAFKKITAFSLDNLTIAKGDTSKLIPKVQPIDATYQKNEDFTWSTNASSIVSVDASGQIQGVNAGTAAITATAKDGSGLQATSVVSVIQPGLNVTGPTQVAVGSTINLMAALVTVNENVTSVSWSSSNPSKANFTVNNQFTGVLRGVQKGTVTVTATVMTDKGKTYTKDYDVKVYTPLTSLNLNSSSIRVGESVKLNAAYAPSDADYPNFTWSSDRPEVVTVDSNGSITGVSAGTARITINSTDGSNLSANGTVTVVKPSLSVNGPTSVNIGEKITLEAVFSTINENVSSVSWSSPDQDKASFATDGDYKRVLTGVKAGTVNGSVTITTDKGNTYTKTFSVSVTTVPVVSVDIENATIRVNESTALVTTVLPANASNKTLTWSSNRPEIATVDSNGNIRGVAVGTATITATTTDGTNITATATITVIRPSISVDGPNKLYIGGQSITLNVTLHSAHESPSHTTWFVSDEDKLKADFAGVQGSTQRVLTGKQYGTISGTVHMDTDQKGSYDAAFQVTVISLQLDDQTVDVGQTGSLSHSINPPVDLTSDITWKSTNPNVLTVDEVSGNYDAKSEGTSQVTIISKVDQHIIASATVTVAQPRVAIDGDQVVNINGTTTLTASLKSSHQHAKTFTWALDKPNQTFANVTKPSEDARAFSGKNVGVVTGTVSIVTDKNIMYSQNFSVSVESMSIVKITNGVESSPAVITLDKGESIVLKAALNPATASNNGFKWTLTGGTGEAEFTGSVINETVTLKGTKKGSIQIQVDVAGGPGFPSKTAVKSAEVKQDLTKLTLPMAIITLYTKGTDAQKSFDLFKYLTGTPDKVAPDKWRTEWIADLNAQLQWKSSKANIADVNSDGVVTGLKQGSTTITVTNKDDANVKDEVNVQVIEFNDRY